MFPRQGRAMVGARLNLLVARQVPEPPDGDSIVRCEHLVVVETQVPEGELGCGGIRGTALEILVREVAEAPHKVLSDLHGNPGIWLEIRRDTARLMSGNADNPYRDRNIARDAGGFVGV